ncbi:16S rRNA (uracil(1498)-N(3))-methyltransferase [Hydrogenophaga crassostreae]|uniref:Ribosomal RNA small subunit methyltransferase E n=1 Tax=Hydrogenophaga crassostreae TaxID=1763535 RepID=A0A163C4A3_9BURK|nr:16S rRNA (uracil(1498)-N(3))-methyltransferase [Hydrogenophaga crassostreae]AOW15193.1 16S rRNA (uracil(1498)-N(3))-methyltransferase [Hydrogenophaga crassostreae]OAD39281.1 16S rRNA (uracil(1498)-N(3))-methyltransferase [Hydrogenophaga crassostreae]
MPRFHCPVPLTLGAEIDLPATVARHVQVLRLQPGGVITLFNGEGGEHGATILRMGRSDVAVRIDTHHDVEREPARAVHLAVGMPANDRMDWLVEKATELGVASIQPLHTAHSVLRLNGERATKKQAHWQQVAVAACEQCGGNRVPVIHPVRDLSSWLASSGAMAGLRSVLSLAEGSQGMAALIQQTPESETIAFLSGPEGGLSTQEDTAARAAGWLPVTLGVRVLRAETAALSALVRALG